MTRSSRGPWPVIDRRRLLVGAGILGLGAAAPPFVRGSVTDPRGSAGHGLADDFGLHLRRLCGPAAQGPQPSGGQRVMRIFDGGLWDPSLGESDLAAIELDLLMPGGRVLAWTWRAGMGAAGGVEMPVPGGSKIEVTACGVDGSRCS